MQVDLNCRPAYTAAVATLDHGETLTIVGECLGWMSDGIHVHASLSGGMIRSTLRHHLNHESLFTIDCTAELHGAWVAATPRYPGDVLLVEVHEDHPLLVESGCLLGWAGGLSIDTKYAGVANVALHEGVAALQTQGSGELLLCSFGGLQCIRLPAGQHLTIDTGYLVAWSASCGREIGPLQGIVSSQLTKEGLVARLTGPGDVYLQTRSPRTMGHWLLPSLGPDVHGAGR